jgi:uncharacterized protein (TIGR03435 family)
MFRINISEPRQKSFKLALRHEMFEYPFDFISPLLPRWKQVLVSPLRSIRDRAGKWPKRNLAVAKPKNQNVNVAAGARGAGTIITYGDGSYLILGDNKFEGKKLPMEIMAAALARFADRPVVDMTGLKGNYDFIKEFSPEDFRAMMIRATIAQGSVVSPEVLKLVDASSGDTLFNAVEKLGLKLESRKAPIETLVIDQAVETPTEN